MRTAGNGSLSKQSPVYGENRSLTITGIVQPHTLVPTTRMAGFDVDFPKPEFSQLIMASGQLRWRGIQLQTVLVASKAYSENGMPIHHWEPTVLPFAPSEHGDAASKRIHRGSPAFLDFMFISEDNRAEIIPLGFTGSSSVDWRRIFSEPGLYVMRINILSDTPTVAVDLSFNWTGDRATSWITCREAVWDGARACMYLSSPRIGLKEEGCMRQIASILGSIS